MKEKYFRRILLQQGAVCVLVIGGLALTADGGAATATGTATATVLESVSVSTSVPPPVPAGGGTLPALSGTFFTLERFTGSLSPSGPLLRVGSDPSPGAALTGAGVAPSIVDKGAVNVTLNADGSLSVSGGSALTFSVSQPDVGVVNIEYN